MKKHHTISLILLALLLAVGFTILTHNFPFPGKTSDDFSLITGSSQTYTPEEIQDAADAVLHYFKGFSGATMTKSMALSLAHFTMPSTSVALTGTQVATWAMPALPGAQ